MTAPEANSYLHALSPLHAASHIVDGVTEYLTTSFSLTGGNAREELTRFLTDPDEGMFHGPFVRTRLPYQQASNWERTLDWLPDKFVPYQHQSEAFDRLYPREHQARPQPTMVVTGTGSGKTEAFLLPILNHARRMRTKGQRGIKALILYPMNALANDQASRLAELLSTEAELAGVTAGIYTGEFAGSEVTEVSEKSLITDRFTMRQDPPDILLTNYKMLDQLLLRDADQQMWELSADSLQYLVLDEFHTYDGAQGTDVALLLRRLGLRLKDFGGKGFDERPLGDITPVATSATLGAEGDPGVMLEFAETIFGEAFDADAVITETQVDVPTWQKLMAEEYGVAEQPNATHRTAELTGEKVNSILARIAELEEEQGYIRATREAVAEQLLGASTELGPILASYPQHPFFHQVLRCSQEASPLGENGEKLSTGERITPVTEKALGPDLLRVLKEEQAEAFLKAILTFMADTRARAGEVNAWKAKAIPGVEAHLWIREVSRIERAVNPAGGKAYKWGDDGSGLLATTAAEREAINLGHDLTHWLPACFCRNCGRSGWMVVMEPNSEFIQVDPQNIRSTSVAAPARQRPVLDATAELTEASGRRLAFTEAGPAEGDSALRWLSIVEQRFLDSTPSEQDQAEGLAVPVLTYSPVAEDAIAENQVCPACGEYDSIRYVGSAVATLLSVALSNLYGMSDLAAEEKKTLIFTDSVQDAAHRAGFVQARARTFTVRAAIAKAVADLEAEAGRHSSGITLPSIVRKLQKEAEDSARERFELLPPAIAHYANFSAYWRPDAKATERMDAYKRVAHRLQLDVDLEFGDRADLPRSLMLTGALSCMVDVAPEELLAAAEAAVDIGMLDYENMATSKDMLAMWARGIVETIRFEGGIHHELMGSYLKGDANPYLLNNRRMQDRGMPTFAPFSVPRFPRVGSSLKDMKRSGAIVADSARGRFAAWTYRVLGLGHGTHDAAHAVVALLKQLAERKILNAVPTDRRGTMYALPEELVVVTREQTAKVLECGTCRAKTGVAAEARKQLISAPCFATSCTGHLREVAVEDNYYRKLYSTTEPRSVVAGEHTGMIQAEQRQELEEAFRSDTATAPDAPNVLVATPTLEMGIDIGSLSTVMLSSMPDTVASYIQRVGRAGRRSGNSLIVALIQGRGKALPKLNNPLSVISGAVQPPAAFLRATEILQRQLFARILDTLNLGDIRQAADVFGTHTSRPSVVEQVHNLIDSESSKLKMTVDGFIDSLNGFTDSKTKSHLREWASGPDGLATELRLVAERREKEILTLRERLGVLRDAEDELEQLEDNNQLDEAGQNELKDIGRSIKFLSKELDKFYDEWWISALERHGLLPNFTLLDEMVELSVGVRSRNLATGEYEFDTRDYQRGLSSALHELAPGNSFYVQGTRADIDAVDMGRDRADIQQWRVCPGCSYMETTSSDLPQGAGCPQCGEEAFNDINQRLDVLPLRKVSSEVSQGRSNIADNTEDRITRTYTMATGCTIPDGGRGNTWFTKGLGLGAAVLHDVEIRWLNLGSHSKAASGMGGAGGPIHIAGRELASPMFTVCEYCGHLPADSEKNKRYGHRPWCKHRNAMEDQNVSFALGRVLRTQGVLLYLPRQIAASDSLAVPSLTAAILLGFKQVLGGDPQHLGVTVVDVAAKEGAAPSAALLLHDRVPGGTGYLTQFTSPEEVRNLLLKAYDTVSTCHCAEEGLQACPECLLPYATPQQDSEVVRASAEYSLAVILSDNSDIDGDLPTSSELAEEDWRVTEEQPDLDPQSELELRFNQLIRKELAARHFKATEGTRNGRTELRLRAPNSQAWWRMEQEKDKRYTRPDFTFTYDDSNVRPVYVYLDGAQYHVSEKNFQVDDDFWKRDQLVREGGQVWSLTWDDLNRYEKDEGSVRRLYNGEEPITERQKATKQEQRDIANHDGLSQLVDFLTTPEPTLWEGLVDYAMLTLIRGVPTTQRTQSAREGIVVEIDNQVRIDWSPKGKSQVELITTAGNGSQPAAPMDEEPRREVWNLFLTLSNLLWAASEDNKVTTSANERARVANGTADREETTPSRVDLTRPAAKMQIDQAWVEAYEEFEGEEDTIRALDRLLKLGFPAPSEYGEETQDGYAQVVAFDAGAGAGSDANSTYELVFDEGPGMDFSPSNNHTITVEMVLEAKNIDELEGLPVGEIIAALNDNHSKGGSDNPHSREG